MIRFEYMNRSRCAIKCTLEQLSSIRARYTTLDPNARYIAHGSGEICPISVTGTFDVPLLLEIASGVRKLFPEESLEIAPELIPIVRPSLNVDSIVEPINSSIVLRDYQRDAASAMLKYGRGILKVPTRGGKSLILYTVVSSIFSARKDIRTMFLMVPNTQLINQMANDFENYGTDGRFKVVKFSSSSRDEVPESDPCQRIIITNRQWMMQHIDGLPKKIDVVFVDECHTCSAPHRVNGHLEGGFATRFTKMFSTNFKFGMSATDSDNVKNKWNVKKLFGPVVYEVPFSALEENGFVARPEIIPIEVMFSGEVNFGDGQERREVEVDEFGHLIITDEERETENGYVLESQFLAQSREFNSIVSRIVDSSTKEGNCLVLFDRTAHGRLIYDMIGSANKYFIDGSVDVKEREKIVKVLSSNNHAALVAQTATMGVGLTIRSLSTAVLINLKSATTVTLQGIGRGLMVEEGKRCLRIYDVYANGRGRMFKYSIKHRENRMKLFSDYYGAESPAPHRIEL